MARAVTPLSSAMSDLTNGALVLAQIAEAVRVELPKDSALLAQLFPSRLETLYEMAYLRIFLAWEWFLEESFVRYLCGYANMHGPVRLRGAPYRRLQDAQATC